MHCCLFIARLFIEGGVEGALQLGNSHRMSADIRRCSRDSPIRQNVYTECTKCFQLPTARLPADASYTRPRDYVHSRKQDGWQRIWSQFVRRATRSVIAATSYNRFLG